MSESLSGDGKKRNPRLAYRILGGLIFFLAILTVGLTQITYCAGTVPGSAAGQEHGAPGEGAAMAARHSGDSPDAQTCKTGAHAEKPGSTPCFYSAKAEFLAGTFPILFGLLLFFSSRPESLRNLGFATILGGFWILLVPTALFGLCESPAMKCRVLFAPTTLVLGSLTVVLGVLALALGVRKKGSHETV